MSARHVITGVVSLLVLGAIPAYAAEPRLVRVSTASEGEEANAASRGPVVSDDGSTVAFVSRATNLVPGDSNFRADVFVKDLASGSVTLVSVSSDGEQADRSSFAPSLSADGRYVAFESRATNLVEGDTNDLSDIFVHDIETGDTVRASVSSSGAEGESRSNAPVISEDGTVVAFYSYSALAETDTNEDLDVFVRDMSAGTTQLVSVTSEGQQLNAAAVLDDLSADGRFVLFSSYATNVITPTTYELEHGYVHDRSTGKTEMILDEVDESGKCISCGESFRISDDGRYVTYLSYGEEDAQVVYLADRQEGARTRITQDDNEYMTKVAISGDGTKLMFVSGEGVSLYDIASGTRKRLDVSPSGQPGNSFTKNMLSLSFDGSRAVFASKSSNLVPDDRNTRYDVFLANVEI